MIFIEILIIWSSKVSLVLVSIICIFRKHFNKFLLYLTHKVTIIKELKYIKRIELYGIYFLLHSSRYTKQIIMLEECKKFINLFNLYYYYTQY